MKNKLVPLVALAALATFAALAVSPGPEGTVSKTATGSTSATVMFQSGSRPFSITTLDVTSDKSGSVANWKVGTTASVVAQSALGSSTNVVTFDSSLATNVTVLIETATGHVTNKTTFLRTQNTNLLITLDNVLRTNLAIGDTIQERLSTAYTLKTRAGASDTIYYLSTTNGIAATDKLVADTSLGVFKGTISSLTSNRFRYVPLRNPLKTDLAVDNLIYERLTNFANVVAAHGSTLTNINVATTNGIIANDVVVIQSARGDIAVRSVYSTDTTNITLASSLGFTITTNDRLNLLSSTIYTNKFPAYAGDGGFVLLATNNLIASDEIVAVPTTGAPWRGVVGTAPFAPTNVFAITFSSTLSNALNAGESFYKITNSYPVIRPAFATDYAIAITNLPGLAASDVVIISPATGGEFKNTVNKSESQIINLLSFTAAIGTNLVAGDQIYALDSGVSTPVGSATVRLTGSSIFTAPQGRPGILVLDGTSACTINQAIANYGR